MKEVLEFIIKSLVQNKDEVSVTEEINGRNSHFVVEVDAKELGAVIGKSGVIANSIRTVVQAVNPNHGRVSIKFNAKNAK